MHWFTDCCVINCFCGLKIHLVTLQRFNTFRLGHLSAYTSIPCTYLLGPTCCHGILIMQFSFKINIASYFSSSMDGIWKNIASFFSHLHEFLLPLSFSVKGSCTCWLSTGSSCHLEIVSPRTVKPCMHFLKPITFILLSATHLLVMWKNKSMLVLMDFPLLNELSHFI